MGSVAGWPNQARRAALGDLGHGFGRRAAAVAVRARRGDGGGSAGRISRRGQNGTGKQEKQHRQQLSRGQRMVEILKQKQYSPLPFEKQVAIIFAAANAFLDDLPVNQCRAFEEELYRFLDNAHPDILAQIREKKILDDAIKNDLKAALTELKERFVADQKAAIPAHA